MYNGIYLIELSNKSSSSEKMDRKKFGFKKSLLLNIFLKLNLWDTFHSVDNVCVWVECQQEDKNDINK